MILQSTPLTLQVYLVQGVTLDTVMKLQPSLAIQTR